MPAIDSESKSDAAELAAVPFRFSFFEKRPPRIAMPASVSVPKPEIFATMHTVRARRESRINVRTGEEGGVPNKAEWRGGEGISINTKVVAASRGRVT